VSILRLQIKFFFAVALTSVALFTTTVSAQSPSNKPNTTDTGIAAAQEPRPGNTENKAAAPEPNAGSAENKVAADKPKREDLKDEIDAVKAENAAVRELLRKMAEQQKTLLEQVERLQKRLDGNSTTDASLAGKTPVTPATADASVPAANNGLNAPPAATNPANAPAKPAARSVTRMELFSGKLPTTLRCRSW
jgi:small-conductance mechanosensitive channel